jgi:tetratricopeptide (TPR) repeat protein
MPAALVALAACAGVSIDPATADGTRVPTRTLDATERRRVTALVEAAMTAVDERRFADAELAAREAIGIEPRNARALAVAAMARLAGASAVTPPDLKIANDAEYTMRLAAQLGPDDAFVGWMHAVFLAETGHMSAAAETAERALSRATAAPANERAALLLTAGTYRYELGEERRALPHLQGYLNLRPDDATTCFRTGSCLLRIAAVPQGIPPVSVLVAQRNAEAAAGAFSRCLELAPGDEDAALAIATALWRAGELAGQLARDHADERRGHDDAATASRHRAASRQQLHAAAAAFPASAEPWFRLGVVLAADQALDEARAAYQQALRRDSRHPGSLLNFAAMLDEAGDQQAAALLLQQVLAVDAAAPVLTPSERKRVRDRLAAPADQAPRML